MGSLPNYGKNSHIWKDFPCMESLHLYGKTSHVWEDFLYIGRLPIHEGSPHIWVVPVLRVGATNHTKQQTKHLHKAVLQDLKQILGRGFAQSTHNISGGRNTM